MEVSRYHGVCVCIREWVSERVCDCKQQFFERFASKLFPFSPFRSLQILSLSLSFSFTLIPFSPFSALSNLNQFLFKLQHNRTRLCFQKGKRICSTLKSKFRRPRKIIDNFLSPSFQNLDQFAADTNGCS